LGISLGPHDIQPVAPAIKYVLPRQAVHIPLLGYCPDGQFKILQDVLLELDISLSPHDIQPVAPAVEYVLPRHVTHIPFLRNCPAGQFNIQDVLLELDI